MALISKVEKALWDLFPMSKYNDVNYYIEKWHDVCQCGYDDYEENFIIHHTKNDNIDLTKTLQGIDDETLLRMAIDLGIETPDFIPSIPMFRNDLKSDYKTAHATFEKAFREIETDPSLAIGLVNSALESIVKEILKDKRVNDKIKGTETLYKLTEAILDVFKMHPSSEMPRDINTIGSSLLSINQSIENLRSEKTNFHGKTAGDYLIKDPLYAYFVVNSVTTVGLFLKSYYIKKFPKYEKEETGSDVADYELPF